MRAIRKILGVALAGGSLIALAGCADPWARRDTIAFSSGNAVAANRAMQTIEPWPRQSYARGQEWHGDKAAIAIRRYRAGDIPAPLVIAPGNGGNGSMAP